jgi:hypothetical protein
MFIQLRSNTLFIMVAAVMEAVEQTAVTLAAFPYQSLHDFFVSCISLFSATFPRV